MSDLSDSEVSISETSVSEKPVAAKPRDIAREIADVQAESWKRSSQAIVAWCNTFLHRRDFNINTLEDFSDGVILINLLESSYGVSLGPYKLQPKLPFHKLENLTLCFDFMEQQQILLLSVDKLDFVEKRVKPVMHVLWNLMRNLTVKGLNTMLQKGDQKSAGVSVRQTLLEWANKTFPNVPINDFWESFRDGVAFANIVENLCPGHIDLAMIKPDTPLQNLQTVFAVAQEHLGIPSLIKAEDLMTGSDKKPDESAVENYVAMLVSAAHGKAAQEAKVLEFKQKMDAEEAKKVEEVERLKHKVEEEKKQAESLMNDLDKLKALHQQAYAEQTELNKQLQQADEEKKAFNELVVKLTAELQSSSKSLAEARAREEDMLAREQQLLGVIRQHEHTIKSRDELVNKLNSQIYNSHRELENVVNNFRSDMKQQAVHERAASGNVDVLSDIFVTQIRENKSFLDFLNSMPVKEGWLEKRSPDKVFGKAAFKKRWVQLKGDKLYISRAQNEDTREYSLGHYQKIEFVLSSSQAASRESFMKRPSVLLGQEKEQSRAFVLRLIPKASHSSAKKLEFQSISSNEVEERENVFSWVENVNTRISLIDYLNEMEKKGTHAKSCREVVEFITDPKQHVLKVENKIADLYDALQHFKEALVMRKNLTVIFKNVALSDAAVEILGDILSRSTSFVRLELPRNLITKRGAEALAKALRSNFSLQTLVLDHNNIKDEGLASLAEILPLHSSLERLSLLSCGISDAGVQWLVKGLEESQKKRVVSHYFPSLDLSYNVIGDEGCAAVGLICSQNETIRTINLDHNVITDKGAESLAVCLSKGHVTSLNLGYNQISSKGVVTLTSAIKGLKTSLSLDLSGNKLIGRQGAEALLSLNIPLSFQALKVVHVDEKDEKSHLNTDDSDSGDVDKSSPSHSHHTNGLNGVHVTNGVSEHSLNGALTNGNHITASDSNSSIDSA